MVVVVVVGVLLLLLLLLLLLVVVVVPGFSLMDSTFRTTQQNDLTDCRCVVGYAGVDGLGQCSQCGEDQYVAYFSDRTQCMQCPPLHVVKSGWRFNESDCVCDNSQSLIILDACTCPANTSIMPGGRYDCWGAGCDGQGKFVSCPVGSYSAGGLVTKCECDVSSGYAGDPCVFCSNGKLARSHRDNPLASEYVCDIERGYAGTGCELCFSGKYAKVFGEYY